MTDLRDRIEHDLADLRLPPGLESSVLARGRRLRARRRARRALGALAVTAAASATVFSVVGGPSGRSAGPDVAADPPPTQTPDAPQERPEGWWDMPATRMLARLEAALPPGVRVATYDLWLEGEAGPVKAHGSLIGTLAAATGPGTFQLLLYPPDPTGQVGSDRIRCRAHLTTCDPIRDDRGRAVGRVSTDTDRGTTYHEAVLLVPDGGAIYVYVADSTGEKPGYVAPTASTPPLSAEQLVDLVTDPAWTDPGPPG
jgi:hypothetical protein